MSNRTRTIIIAAMVLVIIIGLGITAYPILASMYSEQVRSEVKTEYSQIVDSAKEDTLQKLLEEAQEWNHKLFSGQISPLDPDGNGYYETLNLPNTQIIGYIRIPSIDVELPIYHSIADSVLTKGVGHMPQSSLPVGGVNTHAVLSAHSGMSSSPMFSNLELMEVGDIFYIDILGQTLAYQVYEIPEPVLPADVTSVQIQRGRDLCTLVTCTPYGVDTHRLLVHGERIDLPEDNEEQEVNPDATTPSDETSGGDVWMDAYINSILHAAIIAPIVILVSFLGYKLYKRIRKVQSEQEGAENE